MSLFISDEDDSDIEPQSKRQKLDDSDLDLPDDYEDYDLSSESDLDWEEVPLDPLEPSATEPDSFNITISDKELRERANRNVERIRKIIEAKKRKLSLHNLSLVSYMLHGYSRNKLLNDPKALSTLKKLIPESLLTRVKKLRKSIKKSAPDTDVQLIYILKYLIKWFRLNFKITSNGLRVLGYLPTPLPQAGNNGNFDNYYLQNAPQFSDIKEFCRIVKKFTHNRDMGAQLFTGLLRALGFECRLVFSLPVLSSKDKKLQPKVDVDKLIRNKDYDLLYPYFWTELVNPINSSEIIILEACTFHDEDKRLTRINRYQKSLKNFCSIYYPVQDQFNQMDMTYVVSFDSDNHLLDVSSRYMKSISYRWFDRLDLRTESGRSFLLYQTLIRTLNKLVLENLLEIEALKFIGLNNYEIPKTKAGIKRNPNFTSTSTLRYDEIIDASTEPIGKILVDGKRVPIFFKNSIIVGKSEQQWKFLGRSILPDQREKYIKTTRALAPRTLNRKKLYSLNNGTDNVEVKLYSFNQTCPYIKEKITTGIDGTLILPRNKFGNLEIFRDSMVPDGCCWLKLSNIDTILNSRENTRKHNIQFVPVVTGFRFKKYGYAIPVKTGVIVLNHQVEQCKKFWLKMKINQYKLEQKQKQLLVLKGWNNILKRLRINSRLKRKYD